MLIDLANLSSNQVYHTLTQTLIPRPIAWVLSENADGSHNLAPFSYFNAVCSDPPLIMLSIGKKPDGSPKDTRVNIEQRGSFVVHLAHRELAQPLNESSASLPAGVSEVEQLGLQTVPVEGFALPRLAACRVAFLCERHQVQEIGAAGQALIIGRVARIFLDESVVSRDAKGRITVAADRVDPLGRLGASEFVTFGEVLRLARPR